MPLKLKYKHFYVDGHGYYAPGGKLCGHIADFVLHRRPLPGYDADNFPETLDEEKRKLESLDDEEKLIFDLMLHVS